MISRYFSYDYLLPSPAHPAVFTVLPVRLPIGGPINTGGRFRYGSVLGCVGGAPTNEVWTLAINGATGTLNFLFAADTLYQTTWTISAGTLAAVKTALGTIFGSDNLTVTGTPGTSYTITFGGILGSVLMGGAVTVSATTGTPTLTRTTPGSAGAGQYNLYDNSAVPIGRSLLKWDFLSDPMGGRVTEQGPTGQPYSPPAYFSGYFKISDLTGVDVALLSDPGFRLIEGTAITDAGAVLGLGV